MYNKNINIFLISEIEYNINLIHEHIKMWDPYSHIWKVDKDEFMIKYRKEGHSAGDFDDLIINYSDLANAVQIQETINQVINPRKDNSIIFIK